MIQIIYKKTKILMNQKKYLKTTLKSTMITPTTFVKKLNVTKNATQR